MRLAVLASAGDPAAARPVQREWPPGAAIVQAMKPPKPARLAQLNMSAQMLRAHAMP